MPDKQLAYEASYLSISLEICSYLFQRIDQLH